MKRENKCGLTAWWNKSVRLISKDQIEGGKNPHISPFMIFNVLTIH